MAHGSSNLIHMFDLPRPPRLVPNSTVRIGFLRAWLFFAIKVLFIASLINGNSLLYTFEKNVALLDQYVRNDFPIIDTDAPIQTAFRRQADDSTIPKVILAQSFEPRGPAQSLAQTGHIAGAETSAEAGSN